MLIWKQEFGKEKPVGTAQWDRDRDRREQGLGNARKQILWQRRGLGFQSTRMFVQLPSFHWGRIGAFSWYLTAGPEAP